MHQVSRTLGLIFPDLVRDKIFLLGLAIKLLFIVFFIPEIQVDWFVSFMVQTFENLSIDPWSSYIDSGGTNLAFPYGPVMFLVHLPTTFLGWVVDSLAGIEYFSGLGFRVSLLIADILILVLLLQHFESRWKGLLIHYWLSPLVLFITYWHGQTDIVPVAILLLSISFLKNNKILKGSLFFGCAVAAKHSMLIVFPFVILYLWFKRGTTGSVYKFLVLSLVCLTIIEGLYLFSNGFQQMVISSREVEKIYQLFIPMGSILKIYVIPLVYFLLLYFVWRLRKMNFDLLLATLGVAFCVVILLTPPAPGWVLWVAPMLAIHLSKGRKGSIILSTLFSLFFITYHFIFSSGSDIILISSTTFLSHLLTPLVQSLLNTMVVVSLVLLSFQMFRDGVKASDYYHLGKKPMVIGVSGDVDSGRSTFVGILSKLFGSEQVLKMSEKDYYQWSSYSPMWKTLTPLDPRSSHLSKMIYDLQNSLDGEIFKGRSYNKKQEKFIYKDKQNPHQVILLDSAFSLYSKQLLEMEDVSFFVEDNDCLNINPKIDHKELVQNSQLKLDFKKFIQPQKSCADVIFTLSPINPEMDNVELPDSRVNLNVVIRGGVYHQELLKVLTGVCGLQVNIKYADNLNMVEIDIQGDVDAEDIKFASNIMTPNLGEFIDNECGFTSGKLGLMQMIALVEIDRALKRRKRKK
jgi:uridine kinase